MKAHLHLVLSENIQEPYKGLLKVSIIIIVIFLIKAIHWNNPKKTARKNNKGTIPKHINCPVRICACEQNDKVEVIYCCNHNHNTGVENLTGEPALLCYV